MTTEPIPRPLVVLREEFQAMSESLISRMGVIPPKSDLEVDVLDLSGEHVKKLSDHVHSFCEQIAQGLGTITYESDDHFRRIVDRLAKELNGILDGYDDVRSTTPQPDDFEGWKLLVGIYEDTLHQIRDWLTDVLEFLKDPVAGVEKRQIPADGNGHVNLLLEMRAPKQVHDLIDWLERIGEEILMDIEDDRKQNRQRVGSAELIMGLLLAAMTGWG